MVGEGLTRTVMLERKRRKPGGWGKVVGDMTLILNKLSLKEWVADFLRTVLEEVGGLRCLEGVGQEAEEEAERDGFAGGFTRGGATERPRS